MNSGISKILIMKILNVFIFTILTLVIVSCKTTNPKHRAFWDHEYLLKHPEVNMLIGQYENGYICQELKNLRTDLLQHSELSGELHAKGYKCKSKPLYFYPNGKDNLFLTKKGKSTTDRYNKNIVYQEIWTKNHCVVRIKPSGFPGNRRSYPHANKAVIIEPEFYSYDNEAFKVTNGGLAVPKGPGYDVGMAKCNDDLTRCKQQIDNLMSDLHPMLLSPTPNQFCNRD